jgi:hypothetical protein
MGHQGSPHRHQLRLALLEFRRGLLDNLDFK